MIDYSCPICEKGSLYFITQDLILKEYHYKFTQEGQITKRPKVYSRNGGVGDCPDIIIQCDKCDFDTTRDINYGGYYDLTKKDKAKIEDLFKMFVNNK